MEEPREEYLTVAELSEKIKFSRTDNLQPYFQKGIYPPATLPET